MTSLIVAVCLHCAILKDLYVFKGKKSPKGQRYAVFSSKSSKCDFQDFKNV